MRLLGGGGQPCYSFSNLIILCPEAVGFGSYGLNTSFKSKAIASFSFVLLIAVGYKTNNGAPSKEDKVNCNGLDAPSCC